MTIFHSYIKLLEGNQPWLAENSTILALVVGRSSDVGGKAGRDYLQRKIGGKASIAGDFLFFFACLIASINSIYFFLTCFQR